MTTGLRRKRAIAGTKSKPTAFWRSSGGGVLGNLLWPQESMV
jgi:hypothetical protein